MARIQFSLQGESLEYFILYGPTPKEVLRKLTVLTGEPGLPPPWSFGLWLSTSFTTNYDEATVTSFIDEMKRRDLPLHVFHFDSFGCANFSGSTSSGIRSYFPTRPECCGASTTAD